jgi:hypothetical protein
MYWNNSLCTLAQGDTMVVLGSPKDCHKGRCNIPNSFPRKHNGQSRSISYIIVIVTAGLQLSIRQCLRLDGGGAGLLLHPAKNAIVIIICRGRTAAEINVRIAVLSRCAIRITHPGSPLI